MNALEKKVAKLIEQAERIAQQLAKKQREIQDAQRDMYVSCKCTHPLTEDFQWEHDNGYGKQTMHRGKKCKLCGLENYWPGHSSNWTEPSRQHYEWW